jgi:hypothetical protein
MVLVVLSWVGLQILGWALVYWPHIPAGFAYSPGIDPSKYHDLAEALYLSTVTLSTLGFGDVVPSAPFIRALTPLEALTGFGLLTAALTWFTQIYAPLSRRRALALKLRGLAVAGFADRMQVADVPTAALILDAIAAEIAKVDVDFIQYTEGFYFREEDPDLSLAKQLGYAVQVRDVVLSSNEPCLRLAGEQLSAALEHLAATLGGKFLTTRGSTEDIFAAYAAEHGQNPAPGNNDNDPAL